MLTEFNLRTQHILLVFIILFTQACGLFSYDIAETNRPAAFTVADAADIAILTNLRRVDSNAGLRIIESSLLRFEEREPSPNAGPYRLVDAVRFRSGMVALVDRTPFRLMVFDSTGRFTRTLSRAGEGPCELRALNSIWPLPGDSVGIYDSGTDGLQLIGLEGSCGSRLQMPRSIPRLPRGLLPGIWTILDISENGEVFYVPAGSIESDAKPGIEWYSRPLLVGRARGGAWDTVGMYRSHPTFWTGSGAKGLHLAPRASLAINDSVVVYGLGDDFEFRIINRKNLQTRAIRWPGKRLPVSDADIAELEARLRENRAGISDESMERELANYERMPTKPVYSRLLIDSEGWIWVGRINGTPASLDRGTAVPSWWEVFDHKGVWRDSVSMPLHFRVKQIGRNFLFGFLTDSLDSRSAVQFELNR